MQHRRYTPHRSAGQLPQQRNSAPQNINKYYSASKALKTLVRLVLICLATILAGQDPVETGDWPGHGRAQVCPVGL